MNEAFLASEESIHVGRPAPLALILQNMIVYVYLAAHAALDLADTRSVVRLLSLHKSSSKLLLTSNICMHWLIECRSRKQEVLVHFPLIEKSRARSIRFAGYTRQWCLRKAIFVVEVVINITLSAQFGTLDHEVTPQEACWMAAV